MNAMARRMFELVEPIGVIPYSADDPNEAMFALGFSNYWDTYFAGRAAPLGVVPAEVVDALFYNFAPGEVARHIPKVWQTTTPEAALAARYLGCTNALRRILADHVARPAFARAAELLTNAATSAPVAGRPMYAALRALPVPDDVVARLFHAASLLREHRGDGHIAALMSEGIGGVEAHVLYALGMDMPAEKFGRVHHLPRAQLAAVIAGMRGRGLIGSDGWLTAQGRAVHERVESLTDDLAAKPYEILGASEVDELTSALEPLAALLLGADEHWTPRTMSIAEAIEAARDTEFVPVTFESCDHVTGPFFHGTRVAFGPGDEVVPNHGSNYHDGRISNHVYFSALLEPAIWGAELAVALSDEGGSERLYVVEPTGPFEDDPNVTNKRFPGNVTQSYRTRHPLRIVREVGTWERHPPEVLQAMVDNLARLRAEGRDVIED